METSTLPMGSFLTATGHYILRAYRSHCSLDKKPIKSNLHIPQKKWKKNTFCPGKKGLVVRTQKTESFTKTQTPRL